MTPQRKASIDSAPIARGQFTRRIGALGALALLLLVGLPVPASATDGTIQKSGTVFNDLNGGGARDPGDPGLAQWGIRAYTFPGNVLAATQVPTDSNGFYVFTLPPGTYTFCEVLQPGWTQTFPSIIGGEVVSCTGIDNTVTLGPIGYRETLIDGQNRINNDFGNHLPPPVDCSALLNFSDSQYTACFTDVRRGSDINDDNALDLGGTGHTALNFTGGAGPAGDTWLTKFTPNGGTLICGDLVTVEADVLIHTYNNTKGAGLAALLNFAPGDKGLALILYDQGNSDALQLATIDPATGQLTKLKSVSLGAGIAENAWYHVLLNAFDVGGGDVRVFGQVSRHLTPTDPNSPIGAPVGPTLEFQGSRSALGLEFSGETGIVASAFSTNVNSSVTNWQVEECL